MQVDFPDERTQRLFNSSRELAREYGAPCARLIQRRLDDLRAVPCLEDARALPGKLEELKGARKGQLSMRLAGAARLIFNPSSNPVPTKPDGGLDWAQVRAITTTGVENYHD